MGVQEPGQRERIVIREGAPDTDKARLVWDLFLALGGRPAAPSISRHCARGAWPRDHRAWAGSSATGRYRPSGSRGLAAQGSGKGPTVRCPQIAIINLNVLTRVDHALVAVELIGGLYTLTVLTGCVVTLLTRNGTRRKTGLKILNVLLKIKPRHVSAARVPLTA